MDPCCHVLASHMLHHHVSGIIQNALIINSLAASAVILYHKIQVSVLHCGAFWSVSYWSTLYDTFNMVVY